MIEHGKRYVRRDGTTCTVYNRESEDYPFRDHPDEITYCTTYTSEGYEYPCKTSPKDLMRLAEEETEGSMYMWRYGTMVILSPSCELEGDFEYIGEVQ